MEVPLEISYRNVVGTPEVETLIRKRVAKLERLFDHVISCRVAIERPQQHQRTANPYRVRIDLRIPGRELVVDRQPREGEAQEDLQGVLRHAFDAASRQLREVAQRIRGAVKAHPGTEVMGFVVRLFREDGYGFLKTADGREIYFHRNSVLNDDFARIEVGTGVRFAEELGEKGPQATTVQIVDKPGVRAAGSQDAPSGTPLGWGP